VPPRPPVDVVVPFRGPESALAATRTALSALRLRDGDTVRIADNRPGGDAGARASSYFARNRGAAAGVNPWILFLDSDVEPAPDLLDRHLDPPPGAGTALLAGAIEDEPAGPGAPPALRYAALTGAMSQDRSLADLGPWGFAKTANAMVRRQAFEAVGGFAEGIRSGGDADLTYRLRAAGWDLEPRPAARVLHRNRPTVRALLRQLIRHGAGAAWIARRHPGALPARSLPGLVRWTGRRWRNALSARRRGDADAALVAALDPLAAWAFELGRRLRNDSDSI
jgi:mycofactocin glycosyltransferase